MAREGVGFFHGKYLLPLSIFHYESVSQRPNFCLNIFFQMDKKAYPVLYLFDLLYCHCITDIAKMVPKHAIHQPKTGYVTYYKVLISKNFNSILLIVIDLIQHFEFSCQNINCMKERVFVPMINFMVGVWEIKKLLFGRHTSNL